MGQLTLTRRPGQSLVIETLTGETICTVTTIKIEHGRTTFVLEGPPAVVFRRAELPSSSWRNQRAQTPAGFARAFFEANR